MSQSGHDAFQRFFREHSREPDKTAEVMRCLSAFFWKAEQRTYSLSPGWQVATDRVRAAISAAIGREARAVEWVSLRDLFGGSSAPRVLDGTMWQDLLRRPLWWALQQAHTDDLCSSSDPALLGQYWDSLRRNLLAGLHAAACRDVTAANPEIEEYDPRWIALSDNLWLNLGDSLQFFVGFSGQGRAAAAARLQPLIRLLPEAIPLCERRADPGHWLVLSA